MWIATARKRTSGKWKNVDVSWQDFCKRLEAPLRTGETTAEYQRMTRDEQSAAKEAAGGFVGGYLNNGQRRTENVRERSLVTIDIDDARLGQWATTTAIYDDVAMCCYSTHSHTPEKPRLRWIVPLSRPVSPDEYQPIARKVATWIGIDSVDPASYKVAQLMYWPTCSLDGEYEYHVQMGKLLNPDEVLAEYPDWRDASAWPTGASEVAARNTETKRAGDPLTKPGIVGLFNRCYDVPTAIDLFLPDVYTPCGNSGTRYTYAPGSTAGGAVVYENGLLLYSNHATDPASGHSVSAFDLVRIHKFGTQDAGRSAEDTPVTKLPSFDAMCRWAAELDEVKALRVAERNADAGSAFNDLLESGNYPTEGSNDDITADNDGNKPEAEKWEAGLKLHPKTGIPLSDINNARLILANDPALKGKFGYDVFSGLPKLRGDVPWRPKGSVDTSGRGTLWSDRDDAGLRWYMQTMWDYDHTNNLLSALELCMQANAFHPVRDYLNSLEWDGTPRLDTMFIDFLGAKDNAYTRSATRKWMCGAVARIMTPGCKFDQAIVLNSQEQGIGKSTFADVISKGWFSDSTINMNDKDGYAALHGSWIIELAELASTKRSDVETVKTFLSKREDTYRPAYSRRVDTFKRQCVFYGTTNETEYLRDRTGNRRFWVINVSQKLDIARLREQVDQLWAEAVVRWRAGEKLWITDPEELALWQNAVDEHTVQDELASEISAYLDILLPENWDDLSTDERRDYIRGDSLIEQSSGTVRRDRVCVTEIRYELIGDDWRHKGGSDITSRRVANIMNVLPGWRRAESKQRTPFGVQVVYLRKGSRDDKRLQ